MTENKRFEIKPSVMCNNKYVIHDGKKEYTFPVLDSTLSYMFCKALNELSDENEQLKQQKDKWKQQCIHFKEMLDDMDITYLCDEWIYEELKGDV